MPLPSAAFGWLNKQHHLPAKKVGSQSTKHPLGEETGMVCERVEDPLIVESFHPPAPKTPSSPPTKYRAVRIVADDDDAISGGCNRNAEGINDTIINSRGRAYQKFRIDVIFRSAYYYDKFVVI
jgi:hypothetical protein